MGLERGEAVAAVGVEVRVSVGFFERCLFQLCGLDGCGQGLELAQLAGPGVGRGGERRGAAPDPGVFGER